MLPKLEEGRVASQVPVMEGNKDGLEHIRLWKVIREHVKILRNELDAERDVQLSGDGGFDGQRKHRNSMGGGVQANDAEVDA